MGIGSGGGFLLGALAPSLLPGAWQFAAALAASFITEVAPEIAVAA